MKFGEALELCRQGKLIRRTGWNGKNQFVYWQKESKVVTSDLRCDVLRQYLEKRVVGSLHVGILTIMGHFDIFTEQQVVQCGWLASQGDMQADDWEVLDD